MLSFHSQSTQKDEALLSNSTFTPTPSARTLAAKTSGQIELGKNCFTTPRSRGRFSIYSMARTPYSRFNPSAAGKAGGSSVYLFRSPTLSVQDGMLGSRKHGNSVLDDLGSVAPKRRTRPRHGPVSDKVAISSCGTDASKVVQNPSSLPPKHSVMNDWNDTWSKNSGDKAVNAPSTSSHVHVRSSVVAARILQQLENISPKEKSAESKHNASRDKSPSTLNNLQTAGYSKMIWSNQDHKEPDTSSNRELAGVQGGTSGLKEDEKQNSPQNLDFQQEMMNWDSKSSAKRVFTGTETSDYATTSVSQQQSPKFAAMNNAHKGSRDFDTCHNGPALEGRGEIQTSMANQQLDSAKSTKDKNPVVAETRKTLPEPVFDKTSNSRSFGDGITSFSALPSTKAEAINLSPSVSASEKLKEAEHSSSEAPNTKAGFSMQPKSLSSFSSGDGTGLSPLSKEDDAKSIEKPKSVNFGTFGSSMSRSTPSLSVFDNSKLKSNGTDSISSSPFSSSPLISTGLTNQVVTNFASSASTSSSSSAFQFGSSDKTSAAFDAKTSVTENKSEKKANSSSPAGVG